jgi:segregation and condensation protein B
MPQDNIVPVRNTKATEMQNKISNGVKSVIEALLFASVKPLAVEQIRNVLATLEPAGIRKALEELKSEYEQSNRGFRIAEIAGGFRMITAPDCSSFLKKLFKERRVERLSRPGLETLAIIAYKQPVTKHELESLRNVNIDGVLKGLVEKNLVRICGRKKAPGRPYVFGTTNQFLEYFGLKSLEDLPKLEEFPELARNKFDKSEVGAPIVTEGNDRSRPSLENKIIVKEKRE